MWYRLRSGDTQSSGASRVVGLDPSFAAVVRAVRYGSLPVCGLGESLPFRDEVLGTVVASFETLEHVQDQGAFLRELLRVVRPGGRLLLSTPNRLVSRHDNPYHTREFDRHELMETLVDAGWSVQTWYGQGPRPFGPLGERVPVLRRLAWEVSKVSRPLRISVRSNPTLFCVVCEKIASA